MICFKMYTYTILHPEKKYFRFQCVTIAKPKKSIRGLKNNINYVYKDALIYEKKITKTALMRMYRSKALKFYLKFTIIWMRNNNNKNNDLDVRVQSESGPS